MRRLILLLTLVALPAFARPQPGDKAPAFTADATTGKQVKLSDFAGKTLVLAFYPKAFTGG
jgi:peroxiredoxin Q/BCP